MAGNGGYGFHVANHPTLLIPIFGSMIIELHDGTTYELQHGDLAIAEDCTGKGHISRAGTGRAHSWYRCNCPRRAARRAEVRI